jgi:hypothetical protein
MLSGKVPEGLLIALHGITHPTIFKKRYVNYTLNVFDRYMRQLLPFLIFFIALPAYAQKKMTRKQFIADSVKIMKPRLWRPQFRLDNRITFLNDQKISVTGIDAGVILKEKLRVTLGYYRVSDKLTSLTKTIDNVDYLGQYDLNYGSLNLEFIYKNTRFFSFGAPLEIGIGGNELKYIVKDTNVETEKQSGLIAMAYFGVSGTFKPIRWVGLKAAFGYRKTLFNQVKNLPFEGFYTSVGLSMDIREVIKDVKMYKLKKRYRKDTNAIETAVDLITD